MRKKNNEINITNAAVVPVAEAVPIAVGNVATIADDGRENNNNYNDTAQKSMSKKKLLWVTIVSVLLGSVFTYVGRFFSNRKPLKMTKNELGSVLESLVPDQGASLSDLSSPQSQAFDWLYNDMEKLNRQYDEKRLIQRYVLAVLYYSTNGKGWFNQFSFLGQKHECDWGISDGYIPTWYGSMSEFPRQCDDEGNIVALSLRQNDLMGTVPEELALLTDLNFLAFEDNPLFGTLPTQLGLLTNLQMLRVTGGQVTGMIPTEFGQFRLLDYMDLSVNDISGPIPTEFGQLSGLKGLFIDRNPRINGQVPIELGSMRSLEQLSISQTGLTGVVPEEVCGIRAGRIYISSVCDQSQLVCCCCDSCCDDWGCTGYGGGNICDNDWVNECTVCNGF